MVPLALLRILALAARTAFRQRVFGADINYTLGLVYTSTNLSEPSGRQYASLSASPTLGATSSLKFNTFEVSAKYQFTPTPYAGAMYTYTQGTYDGTSGDSAKPKYYQFDLMVDYDLSKRTDVYVQSSSIKVASTSGVEGTGLEFAANVDVTAPSSDGKQFMARI